MNHRACACHALPNNRYSQYLPMTSCRLRRTPFLNPDGLAVLTQLTCSTGHPKITCTRPRKHSAC